MASQYEGASDVQASMSGNWQASKPTNSAARLVMVESIVSTHDECDGRIVADSRENADGRDFVDNQSQGDSETSVKEIAKQLFDQVYLWIDTESELLKSEKGTESYDKCDGSEEASSDRRIKKIESWHKTACLANSKVYCIFRHTLCLFSRKS